MLLLVERILGTVLPLIFSPPTEDMLVINDATTDIPKTIKVSSPAFEDGGVMPWKYGGEGVGEDTCPPLVVEKVPTDADSLVFIMEDLDVPLSRPIVHEIAYNLTPKSEFAEGFFDGPEDTSEVTFGKARFGKGGYLGPRPLLNHGRHRYYFQFYALKGAEKLGPKVDYTKILEVINKHGIAKGDMHGTFERTSARY
jgi:Raf kinase inhibitor-like YbhB/YbcL family protein